MGASGRTARALFFVRVQVFRFFRFFRLYSKAKENAQGKEVGAVKGSKYTDEDRERALALISSGLSPTKTAEKLGFPKSTVCHWWNTQMQDDEDVVAKRMEARRGTVEKCGKIVDRALGAIGKKVTAAASECREVNDGLKVLQKAAKDGVIGLSEEDIKKLRGIVADYTGVGLRELSGSMKDVHALQQSLEAQLERADNGGLQISFEGDDGDMAG